MNKIAMCFIKQVPRIWLCQAAGAASCKGGTGYKQ